LKNIGGGIGAATRFYIAVPGCTALVRVTRRVQCEAQSGTGGLL